MIPQLRIFWRRFLVWRYGERALGPVQGCNTFYTVFELDIREQLEAELFRTVEHPEVDGPTSIEGLPVLVRYPFP